MVDPPPYIFFPRPPGVYNDPLWDNSILMASFNSCFIFSRLHLFSSSNSFFHSSLRFSIVSFLHSSLRFLIISTNYYGLIDAKELQEARETDCHTRSRCTNMTWMLRLPDGNIEYVVMSMGNKANLFHLFF